MAVDASLHLLAPADVYDRVRQLIVRGQNLLGYRHYEDSVVNRFVERSAENGM